MHIIMHFLFYGSLAFLTGCGTVQKIDEMSEEQLLTTLTQVRLEVDSLTSQIFEKKFSAEIKADERKNSSEVPVNSTRFWPASVQRGYREDKAFYEEKISELDKTKGYYPLLKKQFALVIKEIEIADLLELKYNHPTRVIWK